MNRSASEVPVGPAETLGKIWGDLNTGGRRAVREGFLEEGVRELHLEKGCCRQMEQARWPWRCRSMKAE